MFTSSSQSPGPRIRMKIRWRVDTIATEEQTAEVTAPNYFIKWTSHPRGGGHSLLIWSWGSILVRKKEWGAECERLLDRHEAGKTEGEGDKTGGKVMFAYICMQLNPFPFKSRVSDLT